MQGHPAGWDTRLLGVSIIMDGQVFAIKERRKRSLLPSSECQYSGARLLSLWKYGMIGPEVSRRNPLGTCTWSYSTLGLCCYTGLSSLPAPAHLPARACTCIRRCRSSLPLAFMHVCGVSGSAVHCLSAY